MRARTLLTLVCLGTFAFALERADAQTVGNGPYYATPSWDQTIPCTSSSNCPRFVVLSNFANAAVLDRETGLVWERSPSTEQFPWESNVTTLIAGYHCLIDVILGGREGWRLPTINELASLVDRNSATTKLPPGHPFENVQSSMFLASLYWSATTVAGEPTAARFMDFRSGQAGIAAKSSAGFVWCVRGGQVVDPQ
jgi:Protein of unknown function (DUF1566)